MLRYVRRQTREYTRNSKQHTQAGAVGALFATTCLYPLDLVKTRKQAKLKSADEPSDECCPEDQTIVQLCQDIYAQEGIEGMFAGWQLKAVHTILSNFTYFYWYSFLRRKVDEKMGGVSTCGNLIVASLAGAMNMSITLPMEVVLTQQQMCQKQSSSVVSMIVKDIRAKRGWGGFWTGYLASLILIANPAINYTIFDQLKSSVLRGGHRSTATKAQVSMIEAFLLGALAKSIATLVTYPYIRAKVILQTQVKVNKGEQDLTILQVFRAIGQHHGLAGYYKGCSAQLLNTVLKSALLLMTKEQITTYTLRFFYMMHSKKK